MRAIPVFLLLASLASAQEAVDSVFKVYDANADGVLTKDEIPDAGIFGKVDADGDGKITHMELATFFKVKPEPPKGDKKKPKVKKLDKKKSEAVPIPEPRTNKERVEALFRRLDANKDGKIQRKEARGVTDEQFADYDRSRNGEWSRREATRYVKDQVEMMKRYPNEGNFFNLFDMNRDKKVTKSEYDGPGAFFRRYDHNKNKVITQEELAMGPEAGRMRRGDTEFMADGPTQMPKMGLLDRYDANKDGKISLEELGNAESVLNRLDKNKDGVLSGSEVK